MMGRYTIMLLAGLFTAQCAGQLTYEVVPLDLKRSGADFAPVLLDSSLVFTSIRERPQAIAYTGEGTDMPLADLYHVRFHGGKPGTPQLMGGTLCSKFNDGPATFSPGGDTICFTRNSGIKRRSSDRLALFFSVKNGKEWGEPVPFTHNGTDFSTMAASFSTDGQWLYFASDRPGGQGGMDIWVSGRNGDQWSDPKNLGPQVNSSANEAYPSSGPSGELQFASDRQGGMGLLDLYYCMPEAGGFSAPLPFPAPLNSPGNDLGFATGPDRLSGYFSSDRGGTDKIYRFTAGPELFRDCKQQEENSYCYHFEDVGSTETDTLPLRYEWDFGDGTRKAALTADHCFTGPGTYTVKLNLMDTLSQSIYFNQVSYDLVVEDIEQAYIHGLDSADTGQNLVFDTVHTNLPGFIPNEIHWDFGDSVVAIGTSVEHAYAQAGAYTVKMDLVGGPDGKGGFLHHCATRAMKVIDGITVAPSDTPVYANVTSKTQGYEFHFEELPADAYNISAGAAKDIPFTVQLFASSQRVSLSDARFSPVRSFYPVIERFMPADRLYTYSIGTGKTATSVYRAYALAQKSGFAESKVLRTPSDEATTMDEIEQLPLEKLNNTVVRVSTVRFKSGEHAFDASFNTALDKLLIVMEKYPGLELVIEAHTDDVGSAKNNMLLSQDRAQAVLEYFTVLGIAAGRLRPIGFGENRPFADNRTEAGRALNRRVEFRLNIPETQITARP